MVQDGGRRRRRRRHVNKGYVVGKCLIGEKSKL